jgi:sporulation protein YlmC with PRC-barrel domain
VSEPVSWLLIERGWKVVDVQGKHIGRIEEVVGDIEDDIFNGLAVATGLLAKPRYVPAEQVGEITDGQVQLKLPAEHVERLGEHEPPAPV